MCVVVFVLGVFLYSCFFFGVKIHVFYVAANIFVTVFMYFMWC